jgi:uroporphyrinogen decarboxylase
LVNLIAVPALVEAAVERITDLIVRMARGLHAATRGNMLIFKTSDDYATQRGMMFSPALWRRFFKPGLARQFRVAKELGMWTMMHACGDVSEILPELVDIGLDILEPTQAHLPGMRPEKLKREFGADLTFFGAICTQSTLPHGTPGDVRREVAARIRVLGADGGYIVSPDHTVLDDVPAENVIALYRAAGSLAA